MLEVVYLIFNEGYAATAGDDWTRPALCEDALRLGRILAELVPNEGAPDDALPYTLLVNGERIFMKGWNWVPIDVLYGVLG